MGLDLTLAVSKGRICDEALPLLARAGVCPLEDPALSRKLILETNRDNLRLLVIRAQDVPAFVEHGAADLGITGKDVLMEHGGEGLYEPLDLGIGRCQLVVAGREQDRLLPLQRVRVATKYVTTTRRYYAEKGQQVEIIKLYGSMELAPIAGLADRIVDLVHTGNTLRANGLVPFDYIADITSRLIVNKASMKMKHVRVKEFIEQLAIAVEADVLACGACVQSRLSADSSRET